MFSYLKQLNIDWIQIPAGEFVFGLNSKIAQALLKRLPERHQNSRFFQEEINGETPEKVIKLNTFYISRFPITWCQFFLFANSDNCYSEKNTLPETHKEQKLATLKQLVETKGNHPACVTWHRAFSFCMWIDARLPTSVEWEKAARGVDGRLYPWGNEWNGSFGNFNLDQTWPEGTTTVDAFPSGQSPFGVMDMMGNVYEYTLSTQVVDTLEGVGRSCPYDFSRSRDVPDWFRNRVTALSFFPVAANGGLQPAGFRPILDEWQSKYWPGFTNQALS